MNDRGYMREHKYTKGYFDGIEHLQRFFETAPLGRQTERARPMPKMWRTGGDEITMRKTPSKNEGVRASKA